MDKRTVITLGFMLALIIGGFAFLIFNPSARQAMQKNIESQSKQLADEETKKRSTANTSPGKYVAYSEEAVKAEQGTKLIFFHAPWCPQCRELDADIKKQGVPGGTAIFKTDYDTNQPLRQKYGVTIQTTIVKVDDSGNLVKKYVAYDEPSLAAVIKNLE